MALCKDRRRLAEEFALSAREYSDAAARLAQHEGPSSNVDYGALLSAVNEIYKRCEDAGVGFEQHVAAHECGVSRPVRVTASAGI
jgi:hypothetical protein